MHWGKRRNVGGAHLVLRESVADGGVCAKTTALRRLSPYR
jgi:hypothetical protein